MVELYWGSGSMPAWRAMLGFVYKKVPYESHLLSFSAGDTRKPDFLALNPRGKVPTIRDGSYTLNESLAILAWLDRKHPDPPLFGRTPEEHGQVWRWCLEYENFGSPALGAVGRPILFNRLTDPDGLREAIPAMHQELERLAAAVSGGRPLVGGSLSAADLVWYTGVTSLVRAATRPAAAAFDLGVWPLGERYPALVQWGQQVEAIDGFEATQPPHWFEGDAPSPRRWR